MNTTKLNIRKIFSAIMWTGLFACTIVILIAANRHKEASKCDRIDVSIHGVNNNFFIDKKGVLAFFNEQVKPKAVGTAIVNFNLRHLETLLEKQVWINSADLFFDDQNVLQVNIEEREPVARVFSTAGNSFYLDSSCKILPLSNRLSARVPVFTGFPVLADKINKADSSFLKGIVQLSLALQEDNFLQAMTEQVDITTDRKFELIPKLGKQTISFGSADGIPEKFAKLKAFYQQIMLKAGWNRYSDINLEYAGQIVTKLRGREDIKADSLRTLQLMKEFAARAQEAAGDSSRLFFKENTTPIDTSLLIQSTQRDDEPQGKEIDDSVKVPIMATPEKPLSTPIKTAAPTIKKENIVPVKKAVIPVKKIIVPVKKPVVKPIQKNSATDAQKKKPKIVMPKKNN